MSAKVRTAETVYEEKKSKKEFCLIIVLLRLRH